MRRAFGSSTDAAVARTMLAGAMLVVYAAAVGAQSVRVIVPVAMPATMPPPRPPEPPPPPTTPSFLTAQQRRAVVEAAWARRTVDRHDGAHLDACTTFWKVLEGTRVLPEAVFPHEATLVLSPEHGCPPTTDTVPLEAQFPYALITAIEGSRLIADSSGATHDGATIARVRLLVLPHAGKYENEDYELAKSTDATWTVVRVKRFCCGIIDRRPRLTTEPVVIVDGAFVAPAQRDSVLASLSSRTIVSVEYWPKGDPRLAQYGSAVSEGILRITTRAGRRRDD